MANIIGPDISFYQDNNETPQGVDFHKMRSNGAEFVIIRAGQNSWVDPDFAYNWRMAKAAGLPRGAYWFYDSRYNPVEQAKLFINAFSGDYGELPAWADFEEKYGGPFAGLSNWKIFLDTLYALLPPPTEIGIYSNYYYWRENVPADQRAQFAAYPLWIANYNPGAPLIPEPWTTWLFHQYTENGPGNAFGAESNRIDLNYFNGDLVAFRQRFDLTESPEVPIPPNTDKRQVTHKGVEMFTIERFGARCIVHIVDPKQARVYVTNGGFRTISAAIQKYTAQIGLNGGGWPNVQTPGHRTNEIWASDGVLLQATAIDDRGYINVDSQARPAVSENSRLIPGIYNAWGFDRILGKDGVFNPRISDRVTKDARTGSGIDENGKLILLSAQGNDRYQLGLTFPEMWEVLMEFGAIIAGNNDGGSSSAVINTAISHDSLIVPSDGVQANVINQVLIFAEPVNSPTDPEEPMPDPDKWYEITTTQKERVAPSMYNPNSRAGAPVGTVIKVPGGNLTKDTDVRSDAKFLQTSSGWWQPVFYKGTWYAKEVPDPSEPTDPEVPFPGDVQDLTLNLSGVVFGRVFLNGEEWVRKI